MLALNQIGRYQDLLLPLDSACGDIAYLSLGAADRLFHRGNHQPPREHPHPHAFDAGWKGDATCEVLHEDDTVLVGVCECPPGIVGGTMQIEDEDGVEVREIPTGATWSSDAVTVHEALNVGETTTRF